MVFPTRIVRTLAIVLCIGTGLLANAQPGSLGANQPASPSIYPNPFDQTLNILLPDPPSRMITFQLRDLNGTVVLSEQLSTMMNMQVDASSIPPGTYVAAIIGQRGKVFHQQQVQKLDVQ